MSTKNAIAKKMQTKKTIPAKKVTGIAKGKKVIGAIVVKKSKQFTYLKDGVTGKMLQGLKIESNNKYKAEIHSLSYCLKFLSKESVFLASIKATKQDLNPSILLKFRTEKEIARNEKNGKFSFWLVSNLLIRYKKSL